MKYYLYKIENLVNNKKYIGLTNNLKRRQLRHFADLKSKRHDNSFLQKEFNIYGQDNFSFEKILETDCTDYEIGELEKEYIKKYDSYYNGYNQNEGGNFGASNGGTHLILSDLLNILSAIEFMSRPGQILADMFDVSRTTISRIKKGVNHQYAIDIYNSLSYEERKAIYENFIKTTNFYENKIKTTIIKNKRKLTKEQVFLILCNFEYNIFTQAQMCKIVGVKSQNTLLTIKNKKSYKDYSYEYDLLSNEEKERIKASLLSNK